MRWFFAGLLVANIAFLAWNAQQSSQDSPSPMGDRGGSNGASGLVLLRELDSLPPVRTGQVAADATPAPTAQAELTSASIAEVPAVRPDVPSEVLPVVTVSCLRLGGLDSQSVVTRIAGELRQIGVNVRGQGEEAGEMRRYWVMLPPYAKATAATPVLERLQRAGIKDFYLIRSGENMNAISLGVYSGTDSAQRRLRQIRELKLAPKIEEITLPAKRWWLEFEWPEDRKEAAWRAVLPGGLDDIKPQVCR